MRGGATQGVEGAAVGEVTRRGKAREGEEEARQADVREGPLLPRRLRARRELRGTRPPTHRTPAGRLCPRGRRPPRRGRRASTPRSRRPTSRGGTQTQMARFRAVGVASSSQTSQTSPLEDTRSPSVLAELGLAVTPVGQVGQSLTGIFPDEGQELAKIDQSLRGRDGLSASPLQNGPTQKA